jgi:hypothetical protein
MAVFQRTPAMHAAWGCVPAALLRAVPRMSQSAVGIQSSPSSCWLGCILTACRGTGSTGGRGTAKLQCPACMHEGEGEHRHGACGFVDEAVAWHSLPRDRKYCGWHAQPPWRKAGEVAKQARGYVCKHTWRISMCLLRGGGGSTLPALPAVIKYRRQWSCRVPSPVTGPTVQRLSQGTSTS